jgi:prolyl-tRNA editing enzyme YbaK/EbsC (Cys-tRNA(Pro) deacylase)
VSDASSHHPLRLHPSAQRVADALHAAGVRGQVREFGVPTRTSAEAATALGCDVAAIAMCLVLVADTEPLVVIKSGAHRVDLELLARTLGVGVVRAATADEVRAVTGQPIGGVAPCNWPSSPRVLIDEALEPFEEVWSAAGTPNTVFPTSFDELRRLTGAEPVAVVSG